MCKEVLGNAIGQEAKPKGVTLREYRKALVKAKAGDASAQLNLGTMYLTGEGVLKDVKEAVKWFRKAADRDMQGLRNDLGTCTNLDVAY